MTVQQVLYIIRIQIHLKKTPLGLDLTANGLDHLHTIESDIDNHNSSAIQCKSCGMIFGSLWSVGGCPNCGGEDLTENISMD